MNWRIVCAAWLAATALSAALGGCGNGGIIPEAAPLHPASPSPQPTHSPAPSPSPT